MSRAITAGDYPITITATDTGTPALERCGNLLLHRAAAQRPDRDDITGPVLRSVANVNGQATFTIETIPYELTRVLQG